jgi:hypothetical protein
MKPRHDHQWGYGQYGRAAIPAATNTYQVYADLICTPYKPGAVYRAHKQVHVEPFTHLAHVKAMCREMEG